jgi:beta-xylosidase
MRRKSLTLLFTVAFFGVVSLAAFSHAETYELTVDAGNERGALNRFWQRSVGSCHIGMVNGSHYKDPDTGVPLNHRKAYLLAAKELGFKGVRAHGLFLDDVGIYSEDSQGNPIYSWEKYDELMDFIVRECGMRPIVELSYTPFELAEDPRANYAFWYGGNVSRPKSLVKWQNLIRELVAHSVARYGKSEVDQWYWEVYNEPNLGFANSDITEYNKLYDHAVEGAVAADPDVKIGGSAMDASGIYTGYFYNFLDHCRSGVNYANQRTGTRINFFSHHAYPDNFGSVGDARCYRERHNFFTQEINNYYGALNLEQLMTETGTSYYVFGRNDGYYESHDSGQSASFAAQSIQSLLYNTVPPPAAWSYWVMSDLWEEGFQAPGDKLSFYGIMGLTLRKDNIFKPAYHAFKMMSMLGDRLLNVSGGSARPDGKGVNAIAAKNSDGSQIQLLVYNQDYYAGLSHPDDTLTDAVTLRVANIPASWNRAHAQVFGVDKRRSNAYSAWVRAGSPEYPTDETWAAMKRAQYLVSVKEPAVVNLTNGAWQDTLTAEHTGVYLVVLTNPDAAPVKKCDLVVSEIQWSPKNPRPGDAVTFSAVVKNQGALGSPTGTHHGVAFFVNGVKKTWSAVHGASIPPGSSAVLTASGGVEGATWAATAGTFKITAFADDVDIIAEERDDNNARVAALDVGAEALPAGWGHADLGAVGGAGNAAFRNGVWSVTGSGKDMWDEKDAFHYAFRRGAGNAAVSARVSSMENTSPWAKAGVMIRETETETSQFANVVVTPGNGVNFQWRAVSGGPCQGVSVAGVTAPVFVRLTRTGNNFRAYHSNNGTAWTPVGNAVTIDMPHHAGAGLAVTATNNGALNTATFDSVSASFARDEGAPHGLEAHYYKGIDGNFNNNIYRLSRLVSNIDFDWGEGRPDPRMGSDMFSIVWKGHVKPPVTQRYTFHTLTDDGVRLWVNGQELVNQWVDQGSTEHTGAIDLSSGTVYPIEMRYYDRGLGAVAKLSWSGPSLPKEVIPSTAFLPGRGDLVVTDVVAAPAEPVAGQEVSFSATIKNVGSAATPSGGAHPVAFFMDGCKIAWSTAHTASLAPGESVTVAADGGVNGTRWTAETGTHTLTARVDDNDILPETNEDNNRLDAPIVCAAPPAGLRGLYGRYYNDKEFTDLRLARWDTKIKFNWQHLAPDLSMGADTFSVRWSGSVLPLHSETYTFHTETDDGVRLWVNGQLIIDQWVNQGPTEHPGTIALTAGRPVSIRMDYFDDGSNALANLSWSSPSQAKEIIPAERLRPNGYEAEWGTVGGGAVIAGNHAGQMHNAGAWVQIAGVDGGEGGSKTLDIRYATNEANVVKSLYVNGVLVRQLSFPVTGGWESFAGTTVTVVLNAGTDNVIKIMNGTGDAGGVNIDSFLFSEFISNGVYEAEGGSVGGGAAIVGTFVGQMHNAGAWSQVNGVDGALGGTKTLEIRYATNEADCVKSLYVNGQFLRHITFPVTGGWDTYVVAKVAVALNAGATNTIKIQNAAGDAGGVNIDSYAISNALPAGVYEAELGTLGGGATIAGPFNDGTESVGYYGYHGYYVSQTHNTGAWNQVEGVDGLGGGTKKLVIHCASSLTPNGQKQLYVNGQYRATITIPSWWYGWTTFMNLEVSVDLNPGPTNVIRLQNNNYWDGGLNIDRYTVKNPAP